MKKEDIKRVVLAYSGGLDTSIIIPWLKENYNNPEIIAVAGNVGQADELEGLEEKALKTGATKFYALDLVDDYVDNYVIATMQAGAVYEEYLLGTSTARPCIAKGLVEIALKENADAITAVDEYYPKVNATSTAISNVRTTDRKNTDTAFYNFKGQRVGSSYRGVVVTDGRVKIR